MAKKYEIITQLYERTVEELANADAWQSFLATACRNYKLSFDEQVLLFAQKPDATAVLPIEGEHGWNRRFGRWVNRGATGIAMFDKEHTGRSRLKYYFDISDTHESRFAVPVPIWQMQQEFEPEVIEALGNTFGDLEDTSTLAAALLSAAKNAAEDQITDYLSALSDYKAGSYLEPLDGENLKALFQPVLQNSISYMLLSRCGLEPAQHIPAEEFGYVQGFNTPNTMNALGVATSDISQSCLTEIVRTVLPLIRAAEQNRTFAMRNVMEQVIAANVHHAERAKAMLETLSGELARPMEPTFDELNPPPPVPKEYRLSLGNTVYIGAQQYELLALGEEEVTLFDPAFPLFHKNFSRQEFFDLLKENPLNDQYLHAVEPEADAVVPEAPSGDVPFDTETANRLEAERLIREFIQQEFWQDFTMESEGTLTPIATALTENELHTITVYADLPNAAVITKIDGVTVKTEQYPGMEELLEKKLRHLDLKELTAVDMASVPMVGRIDYLATSGKVAYSAEYISEADFIKEITECLDNGVPITITFYRNEQGKSISPGFVFEQGSMPKGMDVTDNPYLPKTGITTHPLFAKATELIDAYCEAEFDSSGDFFDLRNVPVGHTTITEDIQKHGALDIREYPSLEEALTAYRELPTTQMKALGAMNTRKPLPGSLDLLHCKDGVDTIVEDYRKVEGWENPEVLDVIQRIKTVLAPLPQLAAPPAPKPRARTTATVLLPEIPSAQRHNFRITDNDLGVGTPGQRYANNAAAIRLLKCLEAESRLATPEEQEVLSQYVGWGGLAACFEEKHVQALQTVQPKDLPASEISVRLGATWLPPDVVENFMYELFGTPHYARWRIKVRYSKVSGEWSISDKNYDRSNVKAANAYGSTRINGYRIIEETLNLSVDYGQRRKTGNRSG